MKSIENKLYLKINRYFKWVNYPHQSFKKVLGTRVTTNGFNRIQHSELY